ncbi:hypothetical protein [Actinomadura kijaniata]|uniref:hypothetical protein n=1 Tax=Actinomadura kijaniata TaxID=46161 RepID=UPI0012FB9C3D|nr:hypothetical protein [Actinomadura kijaniata]
MGVDAWALTVSIVSILIAGSAVWYARIQAGAARKQATAAERQAESARDQAEAARQQVVIDQEIARDQAQPYVYVDIRPDRRTGFFLMLVIENTGPTIARNVRVEVDPPLSSTSYQEVTNAPALTEGIASMPPGRSHRYFFDTAPARFENEELPRRYDVTVTAEGPFGPIEPLHYAIDLNSYLGTEGRGTGEMKDIVNVIKETNKCLDKIIKKLG